MEMIPENILLWLLEGDVSIQYQAHRDLLNKEIATLQDRIALEGWGAEFLSFQKSDGHWGKAYYQPKWISTHYTLLDLRNLGISPQTVEISRSLAIVLHDYIGIDGGINTSPNIQESDVCLNGMVLNFASYFKAPQEGLNSIVDFILSQQMQDGGFNCRFNRFGAVHSSLHSTISVLEGILSYQEKGYHYQIQRLKEVATAAREFILQHKLYQSDKTGKVIDPKMLMLSYPSRWQYDILRALDYFQSAGMSYDPRMKGGIDIILKKRRKDGTWPVQAKHPGKTHFEMEQTGKASRWNTLRALRVLKHFGIQS